MNMFMRERTAPSEKLMISNDNCLFNPSHDKLSGSHETHQLKNVSLCDPIRRRPFSEKMPDCLAHIQRDQLIVADLKIEYYQKNNGLGPRFPTPQIEYVRGTKKNCAGLEDRILPPCPDLKIHKLFYE